MTSSAARNDSTNGAGPDGAPAVEDPLAAAAAMIADRPEILLGAAFAGGLALAMLVKRLGR
jgi:hypothetical protein